MASSVLVILAALFLGSCQSPTPTPPPPPLAGEIEISIGTSMPLHSKIYDESRTISIVLPLGYNENNKDYPVLYLLDGGVHQDLIPMAGMAALATLSGQYREFILVGVQSNNRYVELTTPSTNEEDLKYLPENGGAQKFRQHLLEEVMPFINDRCRTSDESAIIGESLAGLFIVETFLHAPESFTHYVAISPSLWWRDMDLSKEAAAVLQAESFPSDRSLYLTIADEGGTMIEGMQRVVKALENKAPENLTWWYQPKPEEHHNTIYNPATLEALRLIFPVQ